MPLPCALGQSHAEHLVLMAECRRRPPGVKLPPQEALASAVELRPRLVPARRPLAIHAQMQGVLKQVHRLALLLTGHDKRTASSNHSCSTTCRPQRGQTWVHPSGHGLGSSHASVSQLRQVDVLLTSVSP